MDQNVLYPRVSMEPVHRPIMLQGWKDPTYLHWPYDPDVVQQRLPDGLQVDTFDGTAWVGLVAFQMERIRLPGTPGVPFFGTFPETNVRTYVRGPDGRPGVWFDSLDVTRLLPVLVARSTYRLPYVWSKMSIDRQADQVSYAARRLWPGPRGAASSFTVRRDNRPLQSFRGSGNTRGGWPEPRVLRIDRDDGLRPCALRLAGAAPPDAAVGHLGR